MRAYRYYIALIISCFLIGVFIPDAIGQKKIKKDKLSETKLREAEFYFTEGEKYFILEDYAKALVLFQKSLEINATNATVYYKIAQILSIGNDSEKALENILKALELVKDNKYFYVLAADIYTQLGDFPKASEVYEELVNKLSDTEQYLFELAAIYLYQNRFDDALVAYDKIEKHYGISEEVIFQKQKIHLRMDQLENAIKEGQRLIDSFPNEESYVIKLVELLKANDRTDEAIDQLNKFLSIEPGSARSRLILSGLKRKQGDMDGALEELQIAFTNPELDPQNKIQLLAEYRLELSNDELQEVGIRLAQILVDTHPNTADAYNVYGDILIKLNRKEQAKAQFLNALQIDESNFTTWQNALQLLVELGKMDSVIYYSDQALELFPNQGAAYYYNGAAHLQKRNYEEAVYALEQGKRLTSANLNLLSVFNSMLGDAYNAVGKHEKSNKAYDAALDFDPDNYTVLNNYSYYLALRKENLDKAEKMSAKVVKNNPTNATYIDTYAWVLYTRKKYKEAKKTMEEAFKIAEGVSAVHYEHYGDILFQLGDIDKAVEQWQIAKGLNPNSELIDKKNRGPQII